MSAATGPMPITLAIGEVLSELARDFPDVSISKIRFLESEGLIRPRRARSGYRRFTTDDVEQLRLILRAQRERYLPLKVIKERLGDGTLAEALGVPTEEPVPPSGADAPARSDASAGADRTVTPAAESEEEPVPDGPVRRVDLMRLSGLAPESLKVLEESGIVTPDQLGRFDATAVHICRAAAALSAFGFDDRHLRSIKAAAAREAGLVESAVAHHAGDRERAKRAAADMVAALTEMHRWLLVSGLSTPG